MISLTYPASLNLFYFLSLTDHAPYIWYNGGDQNLIQLYKKSYPILRKIYEWDMHNLADIVGSGNGYKSVNSNKWFPIYLYNFEDDAGTKILAPMETAFLINIQNLIQAKQHAYSGNFQFSPLIPGFGNLSLDTNTGNLLTYSANSFVWAAENAIWQCIIFPGMPFLIASSVPWHIHYGPSYITQASFKANGRDNMQPVQINIQFNGGKSFAHNGNDFPNYISSSVLFNATITPDLFTTPDGNKIINLFPTESTYPSATTWNPYRVATIVDCEAGIGIWNSTNEFLQNMFLSSSPDNNRIVEMTLDIDQTINLIPVTPVKVKQAGAIQRSDKHGPRFVEIINRTVTGSITFWSRNTQIFIPKSSPLTLFFGGPFIFPMSNVDWTDRSFTIDPAGGYTHTYNFTARAADGALTAGFTQEAAGYPISEFSVASVSIFNFPVSQSNMDVSQPGIPN